ncbi:unnamed protein product [Linum tenue]|uniref:RNase H type-1 domain-containing protein n=1 Tax=Linum tenue TaxID=586396 RepID=A0AAV0HWU2_9ROSI|nr:unnamed protein product [Linum tenue]
MAVGWRPAPTRWITVNSDGSLLRLSGSTAAGGALRDWQGRLLGGFSMNLGRCTITRVEIWGAIRGLHMAWDTGHRRVELQLDSTTAVQLLSPEAPTTHQHASLVLEFRELVRRDWEVVVRHIYREASFLADCLTHQGHLLDPGSISFSVSRPDVDRWLLYDSVGGFVVRKVK